MSGSASAPGSSGNLGPGFDVLGLALDLRCTVTAEPFDEVMVDDGAGDGRQPLDDDHMLHRAVVAAAGRPMALAIDNDVPRTRGLGSSAAVMVAAAAASARATGGEPDRQLIYSLIAPIEGHGDNVAPAIYGGLMAVGVDGPYRLEISDRLVPIAGIPHERLSTGEARQVLPRDLPLAAAARSVSRAIALVEGLRTADATALAQARGDELHEAPRASLSPMTGGMIDAALDAGALHAAWSGAGPTALALATADTKESVTAALSAVLGDDGEVRSLGVDYDGLR